VTGSSIHCAWYSSIEEFMPSFKQSTKVPSVLHSYAMYRTIEYSNLGSVDLLYFVLFDKNVPIAWVPCFKFKTSLITLSDGFLQSITQWVRSFWPSFLMIPLFVVGSPIALCHHGIHFSPASLAKLKKMTPGVFDCITQKSKSLGCLFVLIKDIPSHDVDYIESMGIGRYFLASSLPNAYIPVSVGTKKYPYFLKKHYRARIRRSKNKFKKAGFYWIKETNVAPYLDTIYRLYCNVYAKSGIKFEKLTRDFFKQVQEKLYGDVFFLLCFNAEHRLVCFELVLDSEDVLIPLYLGLDYGFVKEGEVYFNCIYRVMEEAVSLNKKWAVFGQTSYLAKGYAGAVFESLHLGILSHSGVIFTLLKWCRFLVFPSTQLPKVQVYDATTASDLMCQSAMLGIDIEPIKGKEGCC
jgi:hypothetical protein